MTHFSDSLLQLDELLPAGPGPTDRGVALRLTDLAVSFGGVAALDGVTTVVAANQVAAIVGPNGAGKTTLLNAASGLLTTRVSGRIEIFGTQVEGKRPVQIARLGLGRSFQHPPLLEKETVLQNILIGAHHRLPHRATGQLLRPWRSARAEHDERDRAMTLLEAVELQHVAELQAANLPYGARKLVDIVRAAFGSPRLLALDEPTSGLDASEQQRVVTLIRSIASLNRITLVLVEHHMDIVRACATNVLGMAAGKVVATGTPDEVFDSAEYREAIVGGHRPADPAGQSKGRS